MARYVDKMGSGETESMIVVGNCDISVVGFSGGSVQLQMRQPKTEENPIPTWVNVPDGNFTDNVYKTIFISDDQTRFKLVGSGVDTACYYKISRHLND